jgi:hypothetical protein
MGDGSDEKTTVAGASVEKATAACGPFAANTRLCRLAQGLPLLRHLNH